MKLATIPEIKQELSTEKPAVLLALCLRLARFKKENKELLTYLLFEAGDEQAFAESIKKETEEQFAEIKQFQVYYAKKSLRKILKNINKYCRYSGNSETEVAVRIHFCNLLQQASPRLFREKTVTKLYLTQIAKINTVIKTLHEDLQYDFKKSLEDLE